jgi:uncharacterized membrane protein
MRKISPTQAIQAGWIRYKNKAGMYTAFTVFSLVVSLVFATVAGGIGGLFSFNTFIQTTIIAIIAGIGSGLLNVGYAHFARKDEAGEDVEFGNFLDGFRINVKSIVVVMVATVVLSQLSTLLMPSELMTFQLTEDQSQDFELMMMAFEDLSEVLQANMGSFYLFVGLQIFLSIVLMFAPYFASLNGKDGLESLADSIKLALPNFLKIFLAIFLVALIAIPVTVLTIGLGLLVIVPFMQLVAYDIFAQLTEE